MLTCYFIYSDFLFIFLLFIVYILAVEIVLFILLCQKGNNSNQSCRQLLSKIVCIWTRSYPWSIFLCDSSILLVTLAGTKFNADMDDVKASICSLSPSLLFFATAALLPREEEEESDVFRFRSRPSCGLDGN